MGIDRDLAAKAHKLSVKGLKGKAMGQELGVSTDEANRLAAIGSRLAAMAKLPLTESEMLLLRSLAAEHRWLLDAGEVRSPESKRVSWRARKSAGWCAATVGKRLFAQRWDETLRRNVHGLGLVDLAGNGYVWLTKAGWALILAVEAAEEMGKVA